MKKILGLDLGVTSIGWAIVAEDNQAVNIMDWGVRIIPYTGTEGDDFAKGKGKSKNQERTTARTIRKGYDRYQLRRKYLIEKLQELNMLPDNSLIAIDKLSLWKLRNNAAIKPLGAAELGRVLLHMNQKRGYKSSRTEANRDKKDTEYVQQVKTRYDNLRDTGLTIGQYFYSELLKNESFQIKQKVYPRNSYTEEFDAIMKVQKGTHKILTDEVINEIRNEIIYYQRKLKSQKGLVSVCEFEGFKKKITKNGNTKEFFVGPKVAPRTSPIFQVGKIWENINNISIKNRRGEILEISNEQKIAIFNFLDTNEKLTQSELFKILNISEKSGWFGNKQLKTGLKGNVTKVAIAKIIGFENLNLQFELKIQENENEVFLVNRNTAEIHAFNKKKVIAAEFENEPLYKLWHIIYSINEKEECINTLQNKFGFDINIAEQLAELDFKTPGFGNKSAKAIRKILPYLIEGYGYSEAAEFAGYNHSNSLTNEQNLQRQLLTKLQNLPKNSLRQPIVEKILNQMINLVNALMEKFGTFDEIRVELARELKQSKDERNETTKFIGLRTKENKLIEADLIEMGIRPSKNNITKMRLYKEISNEQSKLNGICIYCGKQLGVSSVFNVEEVDVEHIIPKALIFDDSQSNKTLAHRACNSAKDKFTAYDYMSTKSTTEFESYLERVNDLYKRLIISKTKRDKLLASHKQYLERKAKGKQTEHDIKLWESFIERQLRESQYIARKAREILMDVSYKVWATSGEVTAYLRKIWGWEDVLMNLHLPVYRQHGLTKIIEIINKDQIHKKEIIPDWSKRDDHRHHAIDALTIACTKQGFIQRINNLNSEDNRKYMFEEIPTGIYDDKKNLLENYIYAQKPFATKLLEEKASEILISFKPGKRLAVNGVRRVKKQGSKQIVQEGIIVPRGALSESKLYGKIKLIETDSKTGKIAKKTIKYIFENPDLIVKEKIKQLVLERLNEYLGNAKNALASLKKTPIYLDNNKETILEYASCFANEYVVKYPVGFGVGFLFSGKEDAKKAIPILNSIVDKSVRSKIEQRLLDEKGKFIDIRVALKDLENNPIWLNEEKKIPIKSVRCTTGLNMVEPIYKNALGDDIGFVKLGNNHHIAIYTDENGKRQEHVATFWHCIERVKYGTPAIIKNPKEVWNTILENPDKYPQSFISKLPSENWTFDFSLQQNEMFLIGLPSEEQEMALNGNNKPLLSSKLYRVRSISATDYNFKHHLETQIEVKVDLPTMKKSLRFKSLGAFFEQNPVKVTINLMGEISKFK